jgi:probable F420-dependent oxidoreductase
MSQPRPFRFAVQSYAADSAQQWRDRARRVEDLGYSAFHLADHFIGAGEALEAANHPIQNIASVPAMAVAAEATSTLRIGCRVFCIDYRQPAILAKEACTLDFFSGGRLELGLGAGWLRSEYEAAGIPFDKPSVRISRLEEMIRFLRAFAEEGPIDFQGNHIKAKDFEGAPKPIQKPLPPIMIGGGSRRILELAAREADIVSLNFNNRSGMLGPDGVSSGTEEATLEKIGWIREAAGKRLEDLELEVGAYFTVVTKEGRAAAEAFGGPMGISAEAVLASPHALMGTPEEIIDILQGRRDRMGISYITVPDREMEGFAPVVKALAGQ